MIALSWNCCGLGNPRTVRVLEDLIKSRKLNILFLMETLSDSERIKKLCSKFGFSDYWSVDAIGRSGGLALFWDRRVHCTVNNSGSNFIDAHITANNKPVWRLTGFYGLPERSRRRELLKSLVVQSSVPWLVYGDFNDMLKDSDKKGIHKHPQS